MCISNILFCTFFLFFIVITFVLICITVECNSIYRLPYCTFFTFLLVWNKPIMTHVLASQMCLFPSVMPIRMKRLKVEILSFKCGKKTPIRENPRNLDWKVPIQVQGSSLRWDLNWGPHTLRGERRGKHWANLNPGPNRASRANNAVFLEWFLPLYSEHLIQRFHIHTDCAVRVYTVSCRCFFSPCLERHGNVPT